MRSRMFLEPGEVANEKELQIITISTKNSGILVKKMTLVPAIIAEEIKRYREKARIVGAYILRHMPNNGLIVMDKINYKITYVDSENGTETVAKDEEFDIFETLVYEYGNIVRTLSDESSDRPSYIENRKDKKAFKKVLKGFKKYMKGSNIDYPCVACINKDEVDNSFCVNKESLYNMGFAVSYIMKSLDRDIDYIVISNSNNYIWVVLKGNKVMYLKLAEDIREKIWIRMMGGYNGKYDYAK